MPSKTTNCVLPFDVSAFNGYFNVNSHLNM